MNFHVLFMDALFRRKYDGYFSILNEKSWRVTKFPEKFVWASKHSLGLWLDFGNSNEIEF